MKNKMPNPIPQQRLEVVLFVDGEKVVEIVGSKEIYEEGDFPYSNIKATVREDMRDTVKESGLSYPSDFSILYMTLADIGMKKSPEHYKVTTQITPEVSR
jgi:hypothetical protein